MTGASAGIGRAIALELAREGVRLAITGRRREALAEVANEIAELSANPPAVVTHDAMDAGYVEAVAAAGVAVICAFVSSANAFAARLRSLRSAREARPGSDTRMIIAWASTR